MFDTFSHDLRLTSALNHIRSMVGPEAEAAARAADTLTQATKGLSAQLIGEANCIAMAAHQLVAMIPNPLAGIETDGNMETITSHLRHNLRTPLVAMKGFSELILDVANDEGLTDVAESARSILNAVSQIIAAIERALPAQD